MIYRLVKQTQCHTATSRVNMSGGTSGTNMSGGMGGGLSGGMGLMRHCDEGSELVERGSVLRRRP